MNLILYVADEFKQLEGGKTLAVGLYTDRVVILNVPGSGPNPSPELPYGIPLGLLACLTEVPSASQSCTVTIEPPTGAALMRMENVPVKSTVAGGSANLVMGFQPFLMSEAGTYTVALQFENGERLTETFEIRIMKAIEPAT